SPMAAELVEMSRLWGRIAARIEPQWVEPLAEHLVKRVETRLAGLTAPALVPAVADVRDQLAHLIRPGFVSATGVQRLPDLTRYLQAIERRLDKLPRDPDRDRTWMHRVQTVVQAYQQLRDQVGDGPQLQQVCWMIEELRVSYFAQELRTPYPVSNKRIYQAMDELAG
ncbi:MAG: DUF3418 domain-containing protein, partial [Pseudonocardiaceae bacterium]